MSIPKIIHQVWIQGRDHMPAHISTLVTRLHKDVTEKVGDDWVTHVWSGEEGVAILDTMAEQFPNLRAIYDSAPTHAVRSDILRLVILYTFGGVYLDTDIFLVQPEKFEWTFIKHSDHGMDKPNIVLMYRSTDTTDIIAAAIRASTNNCFIAAPPQSHYIAELLGTINDTEPFDPKHHFNVHWTVNATGPYIYHRAVQKWIEQSGGCPADIRLLPDSMLVCHPIQLHDERGIDQLVNDKRRSNHVAIIAHASDISWGGSLTDAAKALSTIDRFASKISNISLAMTIILSIALVVIAVMTVFGVKKLKRSRRMHKVNRTAQVVAR